MADYEFARYKIDPAQADELVVRWRQAVDAIRARFPGLAEANLTRIDEATLMDVWRWESGEAALAAAEGAPNVPEAAAMFSLTIGLSRRCPRTVWRSTRSTPANWEL